MSESLATRSQSYASTAARSSVHDEAPPNLTGLSREGGSFVPSSVPVRGLRDYSVVKSFEMIFHVPSVLMRWKKSTRVAEPLKPVSETTTAATLPSMRIDSISA